MCGLPLINLPLALLLSPLLLGVINRVKARFAGRTGQPLLQPYRDIAKLLRKGATYSRTTSWIFRAGPVVGLAAAMAACLLVPMGSWPATISFAGDLVLLAYLLGLTRFMTMLAAMDTGSSFEGMGASREAIFGVMAEPALLLGLAAMVRQTGSFSLSGVYGQACLAMVATGPAILLVAFALLAVLLTENCRIPVDDPNTHLELTMIHEVMVLDHSGVDFGLIQYGAAVKLWVIGSLLCGLLMPMHSGSPALELGIFLALMLAVAVVVGVIESTLARLRLMRVPHLLMGATALSVLALVLALR